MLNETKTANHKTFRLILVTTICVLVLAVLVAYVKVYIVQRYINDGNQAETVSISQLVIAAADGTKVDAPVEPKTGDIYFPQAKLYLPSSSNLVQLTYAYDQSNVLGYQLSISNSAVFNQNAAKLYNAKNVMDVYAAIPKLQSCQRGIAVAYSKLDSKSDEVLKRTVQLNNGKTLYLYAESQCPELNDTLKLLQGLKSY